MLLSSESVLDIAVRNVGHRTVLHVAGEIDLATAPRLSQQAGYALSDGTVELWIDLTDVEFMDVTGLNALLSLQELAIGDGRRLAVIVPPGRVHRLFDLTGATEHLQLFDDRSQAQRLT